MAPSMEVLARMAQSGFPFPGEPALFLSFIFLRPVFRRHAEEAEKGDKFGKYHETIQNIRKIPDGIYLHKAPARVMAIKTRRYIRIACVMKGYITQRLPQYFHPKIVVNSKSTRQKVRIIFPITG